MKKVIAIALAGAIGLTGLISTNIVWDDCPVLKVANWAEYIHPGDPDEGIESVIKSFEKWYKEKTGERIRVEYCIADDNEILYNMIKMGDHFDLICPSEYMLMKLAAENRIRKLPQSFFETSNELNYYAQNVSPYIKNILENGKMKHDDNSSWSEYAAGYMWGTTGFVYNPKYVNETDVKTWNVFTNPDYKKKITAKNNIRDTYFTGLAMYYEEELKAFRQQFELGQLSLAEYRNILSEKMNDTSEATMNGVKAKLMAMTDNLYGFETDEGKKDMVEEKIYINYQWSGDATYTMYVAEGLDEEVAVEDPLYLEYCIPDAVSNLWFDCWALTKDCKNENAATMFINFLSQPDIAALNMDYIGYTSCIGGDNVFEYVKDIYGDENGAEVYDLNYFFNTSSTSIEKYTFTISESDKYRLFAQFPKEDDLARCITMEYFDADANSRANSMWSDITFF